MTLKTCRRCGKVFKAPTRFWRYCFDCSKSKGENKRFPKKFIPERQ